MTIKKCERCGTRIQEHNYVKQKGLCVVCFNMKLNEEMRQEYFRYGVNAERKRILEIIYNLWDRESGDNHMGTINGQANIDCIRCNKVDILDELKQQITQSSEDEK